VLLNLAANGLKFTKRGEVLVAAAIGDRDASGISLCFRVRDTGIGMNEAQLGRLFEPFAQADDSINRIYGGTGLGLAISARIVQQMGGRIAVESAVGQGSTFSFVVRFSVVDGAALVAPPPRAQVPRPLAGARLLLVEDVDINRQIAREILESAGASVEEACDGLEATRRFESGGPFAAIVMDVQMPVMDGYQAAAAIRKHPRGADIPIIALSAHGLEEERARCFAAGMTAYVSKPIDPDRLVAAVAERMAPGS
jgi:CheY-like chemotaxis protein